jgi:hypothetical protein
MKKVILISVILLIGVDTSERVSAKSNVNQRPFEEIFSEIGYQSIEEALEAFESHFKQEVQLPYRLPPIVFTHQFGRFNDLEGNINDSIEIEYINEQKPENHYNIDIRPLKNKIEFKDRGNQTEYTLQNGQKAIYIVDRNYNLFVFENGGWQYMLGVGKNISNKVTWETFMNIANSIDMPKKKDG